MIVFKTWKKITYKLGTLDVKGRHIWSGWFLFGVIPLYLRRYDIDINK